MKCPKCKEKMIKTKEGYYKCDNIKYCNNNKFYEMVLKDGYVEVTIPK